MRTRNGCSHSARVYGLLRRHDVQEMCRERGGGERLRPWRTLKSLETPHASISQWALLVLCHCFHVIRLTSSKTPPAALELCSSALLLTVMLEA